MQCLLYSAKRRQPTLWVLRAPRLRRVLLISSTQCLSAWFVVLCQTSSHTIFAVSNQCLVLRVSSSRCVHVSPVSPATKRCTTKQRLLTLLLRTTPLVVLTSRMFMTPPDSPLFRPVPIQRIVLLVLDIPLPLVLLQLRLKRSAMPQRTRFRKWHSASRKSPSRQFLGR